MINFELTNAVYFMEGEQIRVMDGDSCLYEGPANLMPYWLTRSAVNHIKAVSDTVVIGIDLSSAFSNPIVRVRG